MTETTHGTVRTFENLIARIGNGALSAEAATEYVALIESMKQAFLDGAGTKIKGEMTVKLKFEYDGKSELWEVAPELTVKEPKKIRSSSIFFDTKDNHLTVFNPHQQDMFIKDVSDEPRALRDA